jgi:hypothetical protein
VNEELNRSNIESLRKDILSGKIIPFIGAGVSQSVKIAYIGELGHLNRKHLDSLCKNIF